MGGVRKDDRAARPWAHFRVNPCVSATVVEAQGARLAVKTPKGVNERVAVPVEPDKEAS